MRAFWLFTKEGIDTDDLTVGKWNFRQSTWDAAAFVGDCSILLPLEAAVSAFLCLLNSIIQETEILAR